MEQYPEDWNVHFAPDVDRAMELIEAVVHERDGLGSLVSEKLWEIEFPEVRETASVEGRQLAGIQLASDLLTFTDALIAYIASELDSDVDEVLDKVRKSIALAIEKGRDDFDQQLEDLMRLPDDQSGPVTE